jgi:hypothetical protein
MRKEGDQATDFAEKYNRTALQEFMDILTS